MKYNDNIEIIEILPFPIKEVRKLKKNEWFALMVIDRNVEDKSDLRKEGREFFDFEKGWLGLEQTSDGKIYISKDLTKRKEYYRGDTCLVRVKDKSKCCELNY